jgi:crotonobetainyl-CoA:carnitine CoA-transferase CaiB-like acyl-CoA transferase
VTSTSESPTSPDPTDPGPLTGITVADFSRVLAGPLATMMLGDLGADVIKIERPEGGDDTRSWGPPFTDDGTSAYYLSVNRNKRSVALDLTDPDQRAKARDIALSADVVIENFRAGTMERFGLDYDSLVADNPGLVYCRVSGFGNAEGRDLPGYDFIVQAASGFMSITGDTDGPATKTGVAIIDVFTGLNATVGILAALNERNLSGRGQVIEVNLLSSALAALVNQASNYLTTGMVPTRMGNAHPSITPYETMTTATSPIALAAGNGPQFARLCETLGLPALVDDVRFATNAERVAHRSELIGMLEAALVTRPADEWIELLQNQGIPCAAVNGIDEAFALAERLGLKPYHDVPTAGGSSVRTVSNPVTLSRTPATYRVAPPALGAHTDQIAGPPE